jgi:hypothetical protein
MELYIQKTIVSVLKGEDYRPYVLATINSRFLDNVRSLTSQVFEFKLKGDDWIDNLLSDMYKRGGKRSQFELLWLTGLNNKTVRNMAGSSSKSVILDLGKKNIATFKRLFNEADKLLGEYEILITIKNGKEQVVMNPIESAIYLNMISTMKLTIQGGAWSEVGKQTEKGLLYTIFKLLNIEDNSYVIIYQKMKEKGLAGDREIDGIVFGSENKPLSIELKLLGIGNPEIGDEALARNVALFLTDRLTDMMVEQANKIGIKVIQFRNNDPNHTLDEVYEFLAKSGVKCEPPPKLSWDNMEMKIMEILNNFNIESEQNKLLRKLKELTK